MVKNLWAREWAGFYTEAASAVWVEEALKAGKCADHQLYACDSCYKDAWWS